MSAKWIAVSALVVVVVGLAAGFGGYNYGMQQGRTQAQDVRNQFLAARGLNGGGAAGAQAGGAAGGARGQYNAANFANGQVKTISGDTIELSTATEVLKVKLTGDTQIQKTTSGAPADIQPGERITIQGTRGSDGVMTAQNVQIGGRFPGQDANGARGAGAGTAPGAAQATPGAGTP